VDVREEDLATGLWIIPTVVVNAGYDAICVTSCTYDIARDPPTLLEVVFLQVTSGASHSLNEGHFHKFVKHVSAFAVISKVSIFFVLPDFNLNFRVTGRIQSTLLKTLGYSGPAIYALVTK